MSIAPTPAFLKDPFVAKQTPHAQERLHAEIARLIGNHIGALHRDEIAEGPQRWMFAVEHAHWNYSDFIVPREPDIFPDVSLVRFTKLVMHLMPALAQAIGPLAFVGATSSTGDDSTIGRADTGHAPGTASAKEAVEIFQRYKETIPVYGGVLVDAARQHVVLVQQKSWRGEPSWALPRGKMDAMDRADAVACAIREVREETGFDPLPLLHRSDASVTVVTDRKKSVRGGARKPTAAGCSEKDASKSREVKDGAELTLCGEFVTPPMAVVPIRRRRANGTFFLLGPVPFEETCGGQARPCRPHECDFSALARPSAPGSADVPSWPHRPACEAEILGVQWICMSRIFHDAISPIHPAVKPTLQAFGLLPSPVGGPTTIIEFDGTSRIASLSMYFGGSRAAGVGSTSAGVGSAGKNGKGRRVAASGVAGLSTNCDADRVKVAVGNGRGPLCEWDETPPQAPQGLAALQHFVLDRSSLVRVCEGYALGAEDSEMVDTDELENREAVVEPETGVDRVVLVTDVGAASTSAVDAVSDGAVVVVARPGTIITVGDEMGNTFRNGQHHMIGV
eukprot:TRINITY_DN13874_c0_g1_i1.p1 TRINITY_DN13874_c0_g1~~TRINITY_DN13874_c0_g1_i1.p1  ORF type:complete len:565 (-),score=31.43 TRINITY_DN13874_c0_g1_i1:79-1773(-)